MKAGSLEKAYVVPKNLHFTSFQQCCYNFFMAIVWSCKEWCASIVPRVVKIDTWVINKSSTSQRNTQASFCHYHVKRSHLTHWIVVSTFRTHVSKQSLQVALFRRYSDLRCMMLETTTQTIHWFSRLYVISLVNLFNSQVQYTTLCSTTKKMVNNITYRKGSEKFDVASLFWERLFV